MALRFIPVENEMSCCFCNTVMSGFRHAWGMREVRLAPCPDRVLNFRWGVLRFRWHRQGGFS
jgi:hypothetical protein